MRVAHWILWIWIQRHANVTSSAIPSPQIFTGKKKTNSCRQPDVRTIEGTLFNALVAAGAVSKDNADDPVKVRHRQLALKSNAK